MTMLKNFKQSGSSGLTAVIATTGLIMVTGLAITVYDQKKRIENLESRTDLLLDGSIATVDAVRFLVSKAGYEIPKSLEK